MDTDIEKTLGLLDSMSKEASVETDDDRMTAFVCGFEKKCSEIGLSDENTALLKEALAEIIESSGEGGEDLEKEAFNLGSISRLLAHIGKTPGIARFSDLIARLGGGMGQRAGGAALKMQNIRRAIGGMTNKPAATLLERLYGGLGRGGAAVSQYAPQIGGGAALGALGLGGLGSTIGLADMMANRRLENAQNLMMQ